MFRPGGLEQQMMPHIKLIFFCASLIDIFVMPLLNSFPGT
jgi:hypothetical protein